MQLGDCVRVLDRSLKPPDWKRFVCIEPAYLWFLRINTKSVWHPHHRLSVEDCRDVLDHDSYVELAMVHRLGNVPFDIAAGKCEELGKMPAHVMSVVVKAALGAKTLTPDQKRIIEAVLQN